MKITPLLLISLNLLIVGCNNENSIDCLKKTGTVIIEERKIGSFNFIEIHDNINVILSSDTSKIIVIEGGKNLLKKIKTENKGDGLIFRNENSCNWIRDFDKEINIYCPLPQLSTIVLAGFGKITCKEQITVKALNIHHYGNGDISLNIEASYIWATMDKTGNLTLNGKSDNMEIANYGVGRFNSQNMNCKKLIVTNNGESDMRTSCDDSLKATITNTGNIYYSGDPTIELNKNGTGKLIKE